MCISICPFNAIDLVEEKGKKQAKVIEALCKGCGACVGACPSGSMQQLGFKDKQMIHMVEETVY